MKSFYYYFREYIFSNVKELPRDSVIIIYGSVAYGKFSSDLDVAFILEKYSMKLYNEIERAVINFQKDNDMIIDVEVPYKNKLVYTFTEIDNALNYTMFQKGKNVYNITPIIVSEDYFSCEEMKKRLILNILTTYSKTINGDESLIFKYKKLAWKNIIRIVSSYNSIRKINIDEFIELLYFDNKKKVFGEDYLGYKKSNPKLRKHLEKELISTLQELKKDKYVLENDFKNYTICRWW